YPPGTRSIRSGNQSGYPHVVCTGYFCSINQSFTMAQKAKKTAAKKAVAEEAPTKKGVADITETLRSIKTKFGEEAIMTLDESKKVDVEAIPSGSIGLDDALGIGGYPRGRI